MRKNLSGAEYAAKKYIEVPVRKETTLLEFLMSEIFLTHNRAKDLLRGHGIFVDRKLTTQYDYALQPGMVVRVSRHRRSTELLNQDVKIIYEDKNLVVVQKSDKILSMGTSYGQHTVKSVLDAYFEQRHFKCTAHVVHRLDRETSGLMIYAKDIETRQILEHEWHDLVYDRRYIAVLCGEMPQEGGTVHSWLKETKSFITVSSPVDNGGKEAITHYHKLQSNGQFTLVEMKLETGRKNQIRVHMKELGYPVAGDNKYGNHRNPIGRLALHAYRLNFIHPVTGERMEFETPFPSQFMKLFENQQNKNKQE